MKTERMCIACRKNAPNRSLLRFMRLADGTVRFDVGGQLGSRGAYTCASAACVKKAVDRKSFFRAFAKPVLVEFFDLARQCRALSGELGELND